MADFRTTRRVETKDSLIKVDAGLAEGDYIFQLTAIDNGGNKSRPARLKVTIIRSPVIPVDPVIRRPVRSRRLNANEELISNDSEPVKRKDPVKKKPSENKKPSRTRSRKRTTRKKSDTNST